MSGQLLEDVAIISGGGGEIGAAIARRFAREGANVLVTDVSLEKAEAIAAEIAQGGGKAAALAVDVGDPAQCEAAVRQATTQFGKLTVLLNAAVAPTPDGNVEQLSLADWNEALAINLTGYFLMCKYAVPAMRSAGRGSIINIASSHGHIAMRRRPAYCSTKAAIHHFTRVLALDYGAENIRANTISPGPIDTARVLHRYGTREKANAARGVTQALGRTGTVDEVASAALFLACGESAFVTGADLRVDGGQTIWKS
jgi:NAD(P)-dependent dehydrogenase (short-subunit alcohol dehydrogenase family)